MAWQLGTAGKDTKVILPACHTVERSRGEVAGPQGADISANWATSSSLCLNKKHSEEWMGGRMGPVSSKRKLLWPRATRSHREPSNRAVGGGKGRSQRKAESLSNEHLLAELIWLLRTFLSQDWGRGGCGAFSFYLVSVFQEWISGESFD